jgi:hypothetical protein
MLTIKQIAEEINNRSKNFKIGKLQNLRKKIKNLKKQTGKKIFIDTTIFKNYAFHYGGRRELQFNIGIENDGYIRYGVAFSLEKSRSLPDITILYPKIKKFNEFIRLYSKEYSDMMLWYHDENRNRIICKNRLIDNDIIKPWFFIFFW